MIKKFMLAAAAVAMTASPVLANPAAQLSVAPKAARASAAEGDANLRGGFIIPLIAVIAIILGIVVVADSDDAPHSP